MCISSAVFCYCKYPAVCYLVVTKSARSKVVTIMVAKEAPYTPSPETKVQKRGIMLIARHYITFVILRDQTPTKIRYRNARVPFLMRPHAMPA